MIKKIRHGNSVIQYDLIKSKRRKTSQIIVTPDGITVRVPQTKTATDVEKIMQEKIQWICKKQLYFARHKKASFSMNGKLLVLGKEYEICVIPSSKKKTRLVRNTIEFHVPQNTHSNEQIEAQYQTYLDQRASVLFPRLVRELARKVDSSPTKINIKHLKTRWGSATHTGEINLNSNLMKTPKRIITYVILHELCHFKIKEHSHHFWNMVAQHMPEYKVCIKWLEENGIKIT